MSKKTQRIRRVARTARVTEKLRKSSSKIPLNPTWHPPRYSIAVIDQHGDTVATIHLPPGARK